MCKNSSIKKFAFILDDSTSLKLPQRITKHIKNNNKKFSKVFDNAVFEIVKTKTQ